MTQLLKSEKKPFILVANPLKGECQAYRCKRKTKNKQSLCSRHYSLKWRYLNPEKYVYQNLKGNAKRRGKIFTLTLGEFMDFLKENPDYMKSKGKGVKCLQIDRIKNKLGYTKDNIRSISAKENRYKQHNEDYSNCFNEELEELEF